MSARHSFGLVRSRDSYVMGTEMTSIFEHLVENKSVVEIV